MKFSFRLVRLIWVRRARIAVLALCLIPVAGWAQGVAVSGREAMPRRPLPEGVKAPRVDYRDIARQAGLTGVNVSGGERSKDYIIESTGNGVAVFDYDNDGLLDILLVSADRFGGEGAAPRHYLYRNLGGLKFADVTAQAGIRHTGWAQGVCAGDIDDDGFIDLVIPHWGQNVLYRNQGDGTFRDETEQRGLAATGRRWGTGCAFLDYDNDGHLDLFVANYIDFDPEKTPKPGEKAECRWKGLPVVCGPRGLPGETMSLFRNDGAGNFQDVSKQAGVHGAKRYYGFTPLVADYDNDGWPDVFVACDSTASLLYRNQGDGTFEELGVISGAAYNADGMEQAGMGATAGDFDRDGDFDIFKTNFSNDTHTLYRNDGDWFFSDETIASGLAVNTRYLGWGTMFLDIDHDGWLDIVAVNGHVYPNIGEAGIGEDFRQPRLVYWNRGDGQFHDISAEAGPGIVAAHSSRGLAVGDLDNDGSLEIVAVNMHEGPSLLKNFAPKGRSLQVRALTEGGRDAVGARVEIVAGGEKQTGEVRSGGSFISQNDFRVHFGVGAAEKADIEVRWPGGASSRFEQVDTNRTIVVRQGAEAIQSLPYERPAAAQ